MIYRATLRPGRPDELSDDLADGDAMDVWLSEHGRPGDRFSYRTYEPVAASGDGHINDDGEPAYRLGNRDD